MNSLAGRVRPALRRARNLLASGEARSGLFALYVSAQLMLIAYVVSAANETRGAETARASRAFLREAVDAFGYADVVWYESIAAHGYQNGPFSDAQKANWAFFPLWPGIWRASWTVSADHLLIGILLSIAFFIASAMLLYRLVSLDFEHEIAWTTAALFVVFPSAYFAIRPGPEALLLLLSLGSILQARRGRWWAASLLGALAVLARPQGILVLAVLICIAWRQRRESRSRDVAWLALMPLAFAGLLAYMRIQTGNALAPFAIQKSWDNQLSLPFAGLVDTVRSGNLVSYYGFDLAMLSGLLIVLAIGATVLMARDRRIPREYLLYTVLVIVPIIVRSNTNATARFLLTAFPLMILLALMVRDRPMARTMTFVGFAAIQAALFVAFIEHVDWATT